MTLGASAETAAPANALPSAAALLSRNWNPVPQHVSDAPNPMPATAIPIVSQLLRRTSTASPTSYLAGWQRGVLSANGC
jgi:hypothetical protein